MTDKRIINSLKLHSNFTKSLTLVYPFWKL